LRVILNINMITSLNQTDLKTILKALLLPDEKLEKGETDSGEFSKKTIGREKTLDILIKNETSETKSELF
jgi:hypothetical protein